MKKLSSIVSLIPKAHQKKFTYLFVGGLLFVIDFGSTVFSYYAFNLKAGYASAVGFGVSFIVGFTLNKNIVFKHGNDSRFTLHMQVTLYLILAFVNLFITSFTVNYFVNHGVHIEIAKPIMVISAAFWNYFILNHYIFGHLEKI